MGHMGIQCIGDEIIIFWHIPAEEEGQPPKGMAKNIDWRWVRKLAVNRIGWTSTKMEFVFYRDRVPDWLEKFTTDTCSLEMVPKDGRRLINDMFQRDLIYKKNSLFYVHYIPKIQDSKFDHQKVEIQSKSPSPPPMLPPRTVQGQNIPNPVPQQQQQQQQVHYPRAPQSPVSPQPPPMPPMMSPPPPMPQQLSPVPAPMQVIPMFPVVAGPPGLVAWNHVVMGYPTNPPPQPSPQQQMSATNQQNYQAHVQYHQQRMAVNAANQWSGPQMTGWMAAAAAMPAAVASSPPLVLRQDHFNFGYYPPQGQMM